jgi:hypothetical protein
VSLSSTAELAVSDLSIDASAVSLSETTESALKPNSKLSSAELDSASESRGLSLVTTDKSGRFLRASDSDRERAYSIMRDGELESESESVKWM